MFSPLGIWEQISIIIHVWRIYIFYSPLFIFVVPLCETAYSKFLYSSQCNRMECVIMKQKDCCGVQKSQCYSIRPCLQTQNQTLTKQKNKGNQTTTTRDTCVVATFLFPTSKNSFKAILLEAESQAKILVRKVDNSIIDRPAYTMQQSFLIFKSVADLEAQTDWVFVCILFSFV